MKVKIGKYVGWFGPYQLAEKLMFWVPKEKDEYGVSHTADRVHNFGEWLAHGSIEPELDVGNIAFWREERPKTWLYKFLLWANNKQRTIKVRIDRWDTWSMDHTLAYIILPMLKQLKETKQGVPFIEDKDIPEENDWNNEKRWDWVLDEMIFAFENKLDNSWEEQFTTGHSDIGWKKLEDGTMQMIHGPNHTLITDWEGKRAYQERITNGFRLFGTYYEHLWD